MNGKKHGKGIYYYSNGNIKFDGDFNYGKIEGNAKYIDENGNCYIGLVLNGKFDGMIFDKDGNPKNENQVYYGQIEEKKCCIF